MYPDASDTGLSSGPLLRLIAYAGAGYGEKTVFWQDIDGNWMDVSDVSVKGVAAETGCILHLGVFGISFGISSTGFKSAGLKAGLGLVF
ncbi:MAG: hypothetical protein MJY41_00080 [Bacteroidales bacterium]|nr:hypothetical protein [Bacteroidales bacterium]